jgi:hypothetical protein
MDLRSAIMARYAVKIRAYLKFDRAAGRNGFMGTYEVTEIDAKIQHTQKKSADVR